MIKVNVNGQELQVAADPETPLLWVLRDTLGLTGTSTAAAWRCAERAPCTSMVSRYARASLR